MHNAIKTEMRDVFERVYDSKCHEKVLVMMNGTKKGLNFIENIILRHD